MIKDALVFWNPWWSDSKDRLDELMPRSSQSEIEPIFRRKEVTAITGVRRSGKTSLMYLLIKKILKKEPAKQVLYVNLEDPSLEEVPLDGIYSAYEELMVPTGKRYLFLDEIQSKEGWERWVKKVYDSSRDIKIVVSGSNSSLLQTEYSSYLSGRNLTYEMFPLSFGEFLTSKGLSGRSEREIIANKSKIKHLLDEYLRFGGFPEVVLETREDMKYTLLKEYFNSILARDILRRYDIKERKKLEKLAVFLMTNTSNMVSAKSLGNTVSLNIRTVSEYMDHLEACYLFFFINHFSFSLKAQYTYPRKVYCVDVGIRNAVSFSFSQDVGRLIENMVFLKLRGMGEIYYWKDRTSEVDFVVKRGQKVTQVIQTCFEIKDQKTKKREITGLLRALDNFKLKNGTIITWDVEGKETIDKKRIEYVPVWRWCIE